MDPSCMCECAAVNRTMLGFTGDVSPQGTRVSSVVVALYAPQVTVSADAALYKETIPMEAEELRHQVTS